MCEVSSLTAKDVNDQKLTIQYPKGGKGEEFAFIPRKVVDRLRAYIKDKAIDSGKKILAYPLRSSAKAS